MERLTQEALDLTSTIYDDLLIFGKFFHTQNSNDVLKVLISLENLLYTNCNFIVLFTNNFWIECTRSRFQWVNCRINTLFCDGAVKNRLSIQVGKGRCRSRVSQVVCRNINCLYRSNRTSLGRGNTFLKVAHLRCQSWLITYCGRHTAEQCRYLRTSLGETEDVVDKQQYVLALVTEVFCFGKTAKTYAKTCSRRLIHLTINEAGLVDNTRIGHFDEQVGTLTSTLAYTSKYRRTAMFLSQVVNKLLNNNGLAYTSATEQTSFTTLDEGLDKVNNLNTSFINLGCGNQFFVSRCRTMNWVELFNFRHWLAVNRFTHNIPNATKGLRAYWHHHWIASVLYLKTTRKAISR